MQRQRRFLGYENSKGLEEIQARGDSVVRVTEGMDWADESFDALGHAYLPALNVKIVIGH